MDKALRQKILEQRAQVESCTFLESPILSVRQDTLYFEDLPQHRRFVVTRPGAVAMVPITEKGNVLLIKQWRYPIQEIIYEIPAGCLDLDESPESCAQRELQEEIDYKAEELIPLGMFYPSPGYSDEKLYFYIAKKLKQSSLDGDEHEQIDVEEFTLKQCFEMIDNGTIVDVKTAMALLRYERWLKRA